MIQNRELFPEIALQITDIAQSPSARAGIVLPAALHRQWNITSRARRVDDEGSPGYQIGRGASFFQWLMIPCCTLRRQGE